MSSLLSGRNSDLLPILKDPSTLSPQDLKYVYLGVLRLSLSPLMGKLGRWYRGR